MSYAAAPDRYSTMPYRRAGRSGLDLPAVSLGLWHNFGAGRAFETQRAVVLRAVDRGVTHLDLANNYGPPPGAAELTAGRLLAGDLAPYRDELVISTKAGYRMGDGPYGDGGSRKYLTASLDASLRRLGLDHVDIFYHHRPDPDTPLEETMAALDAAVRAGKARYVAVSNYPSALVERAAAILAGLGTPLLVDQPSYSMLNRWIERDGLLDTLHRVGAGCVAYSPLAQGLLTDRYLAGVPADSRMRTSPFLNESSLDRATVQRLHALNAIARTRGQSLAQLALCWALRDPRMTSVIIGASSVAQLDANLDALAGPPLTGDDLDRVDGILLGR